MPLQKKDYQSGDLRLAFQSICKFCSGYTQASGRGWKTNDPRVIEGALKPLDVIKEWLETNFTPSRGNQLKVTASKAQGFFCRVPYICLTPPGQQPNNGVFVSVCFGKEGNGAVAGCAESVTNRKGLTFVKRSEGNLSVNVDGSGPKSHYNDSFANPKEFYFEDFSEDEFREHIKISLNRCFDFLNIADSTLVADIKTILPNETPHLTAVQALVIARLGQGKFGSAVRQIWNYRCSVTGSFTQEALEASHIQPWADSNHTQRLDPSNGILLTASLHRLFDAGLISFDTSGKMIVSSKLSLAEQKIFGVIGKKLSQKPSAETARYLAYHRTQVFLT